VYPATGSVARDQTRESKKTKKRIERLESLVMELLDRGPSTNEALSDGPATSESDSQTQSQTYRNGAEAENGHDTDNSPMQNDIPPLRHLSGLPASTSSSSLWESVLQDVRFPGLAVNYELIANHIRLAKLKIILKSMKTTSNSKQGKLKMQETLQSSPMCLKAAPANGMLTLLFHTCLHDR
jgi:hypothetical protein